MREMLGPCCSSCSRWPRAICTSDPLPAPKSWDAGEGGGDCQDLSSFGATMGREPQQNTSLSFFPAKGLSNVEERKEREKEGGRIKSVQKQLVPGEGAAAGVWQGFWGTARWIANRMVSLQHGASQRADGKGNWKGMVG